MDLLLSWAGGGCGVLALLGIGHLLPQASGFLQDLGLLALGLGGVLLAVALEEIEPFVAALGCCLFSCLNHFALICFVVYDMNKRF